MCLEQRSSHVWIASAVEDLKQVEKVLFDLFEFAGYRIPHSIPPLMTKRMEQTTNRPTIEAIINKPMMIKMLRILFSVSLFMSDSLLCLFSWRERLEN
jgi:hypothetical protein